MFLAKLHCSLLFLGLLNQISCQGDPEVSTICRVLVYYSGDGNWRRASNATITPPEHKPRKYPTCCPGYVYKETPDCDPECPSGLCVFGYCPPDDENINCSCYDDDTYPADPDEDCIADCHPNDGSECTCHAGYTKDERINLCVPTECHNRCSNGQCDQTGVCTCQEGFVKHTNKTGLCVPQKCHEECEKGSCTADGTCVCDEGHKHVDEMTCERIVCPSFDPDDASHCVKECGSRCINGNCSSDDGTCVCLPGYTVQLEDIFNCSKIICPSVDSDTDAYCKSECESLCLNGVCSDAGECTCLPGYKGSSENRFSCTEIVCPSSEEDDVKFCKAECDAKCVSGKCGEDGACSCVDGYRKSLEDRFVCNLINCPAVDAEENEFCKRKCELICGGGSCSDEGKCSCAPSS